MRPAYLILICVIFLFSCEKRECECRDDIMIIWKDEIKPDSTFVALPNAVLNIGKPLAIRISSFGAEVEWELKSAKVYKDDQRFIDTEDPSMLIKNNSTIEIPHEIFSSSSELITGPVNVEVEVFFPKEEANLSIEGTVYFYSCEDIDDEFNLEECRWPSQTTGEVSGNLC